MKSWCIGKPSAQYVAKMEDVLDVYERPYDAKRPVVCLDETSKELRDTPRGNLPMQPGKPERQDYEYSRDGVCNLFLAVEPLQGRRTVRVTDRRTAQDFADRCLLYLSRVSLPASLNGLCEDPKICREDALLVNQPWSAFTITHTVRLGGHGLCLVGCAPMGPSRERPSVPLLPHRTSAILAIQSFPGGSP